MLTHGSLFSGIGGPDLAAEWMGWDNLFHCEWNDFGKKVLKYYWPNAKSYDDITKSDFTIWRGRIDILTGGFPCQPYSVAGKQKGKDDERHLWPEMLRAIREIEPMYIVGENVRGLISWNEGLVFDEVQSNLESEGYEVFPCLLPAASVNAPHRRDRIFFIAYNNNRDRKKVRLQAGRKEHVHEAKRGTNATDTDSTRQPSEKHRKAKSGRFAETGVFDNWENFPTQSPICDGDDGFPPKLDGITFPKWRNESIKAGGNAIVPQVMLQIFKAIEQHYKLTK